jgi:hypothetical protein
MYFFFHPICLLVSVVPTPFLVQRFSVVVVSLKKSESSGPNAITVSSGPLTVVRVAIVFATLATTLIFTG